MNSEQGLQAGSGIGEAITFNTTPVVRDLANRDIQRSGSLVKMQEQKIADNKTKANKYNVDLKGVLPAHYDKLASESKKLYEDVNKALNNGTFKESDFNDRIQILLGSANDSNLQMKQSIETQKYAREHWDELDNESKMKFQKLFNRDTFSGKDSDLVDMLLETQDYFNLKKKPEDDYNVVLKGFKVPTIKDLGTSRVSPNTKAASLDLEVRMKNMTPEQLNKFANDFGGGDIEQAANNFLAANTPNVSVGTKPVKVDKEDFSLEGSLRRQGVLTGSKKLGDFATGYVPGKERPLVNMFGLKVGANESAINYLSIPGATEVVIDKDGRKIKALPQRLVVTDDGIKVEANTERAGLIKTELLDLDLFNKMELESKLGFAPTNENTEQVIIASNLKKGRYLDKRGNPITEFDEGFSLKDIDKAINAGLIKYTE